MNKPAQSFFRDGPAAFTLIEMIGVMAILAIMATVLTPNLLHSIERAEVKAEAESLHNLGTEIGFYLRDNNGTWPTASPSTTWTTQLATYSSLNAAEIKINRRQVDRLYVPDVAKQRALLISSMRNGINLPSAATITANFQGIWDAADNTVPPGTWTGWTAGSSGNIEYLVIERVSLSAVFQNDLQSYTFYINNNAGGPALSYKTITAAGVISILNSIPVGATNLSVSLKPRDRINLYSNSTGTTLNFVYVVSNGPKTFSYIVPSAPLPASWVAQ